MQAQIEDSAYREARRQSSGESIVVGVNRFAVDDDGSIPVLEVDVALEEGQKAALRTRRARRDNSGVDAHLERVSVVAGSDENLMPSIKAALAAGATVGDVSDALRKVFGRHRATG